MPGPTDLMNGITPTDDLLVRAFELAYFILGDRTASIYTAMAAVDKLKIASTIQDRRLYYVPTGRSSYPAARTKVSLSHTHLLQRLVYTESEPFERLIEGQENSLQQHEMIIRFVKHLVKVTTKHNSFYVALGLCRLLFNYTTSESIEIYNFVIQDPDRGKDDYYYRSRKKHLLHELKGRFGDFLKTRRGNRGEERFHAAEDSGKYFSLVQECLFRFMPWKSTCVLPANIDPTRSVVPRLEFKSANPDAEHEIELNRIHTLLHPDCFERVVVTLGLDPPATRLEVPHFFIANDDRPTHDRLKPQSLSKGELEAMRHYVDENSVRRKNSSKKFFAVLVDGKDQTCFEVNRTNGVQINLGKNSDLIEVRSVEIDEQVTVAILPLNHGENGIVPAKSWLKLGVGKKLSLAVAPVDGSSDETAGATIKVSYQNSIASGLLSRLRPFKGAPSDTVPRHSTSINRQIVFASLFIAICLTGLLVYLRLRNTRPRGEFIAENRENGKRAAHPSLPTPSSSSAQSVPQGNLSTPQPPEQEAQPSPRRQRQTHTPDSRSPVAIESTRGRKADPSTTLLDVKRVFVDPLGADTESLHLRNILANYLNSTGRFVVVESRDQADAVFKGSVRRVPQPRAGVTVALRLVNAKGQVIWPTQFGMPGRTYTGDPAEVVNSVIRDLLANIQQLER